MASDGAAAVQAFYGRWAGLYDLVATWTPGVTAARRRAVDALRLDPGDTVVDVGCGTGANLPFLRERVGPTGQVVGVDLTPGVLDRAAARARRNGWENVAVCRADGLAPPLRRADAVLASFVVGMFEEPAVAVGRWCDLLEPGGNVALLDATPRGGDGVVDAAFRGFVAVSAPPTRRLRYDESPARRLGERVERARDVLAERGEVLVEERSWLDFLRLSVARV